MKNQRFFAPALFMTLTFACLQIAALGQVAGQSKDIRVATVRSEGSAVRFDAAISYSSATLTVTAPDGNVYRKEFTAGATPSFAFLDKAGASLGNGQYNYEIRYITVASFKERMAAAADDSGITGEDENGRSNRRRLPVQAVTQSGAFAVQNGTLYVGNETEPRTDRSPLTKGVEKSPEPTRSQTVVSGNTANRLLNHRLSLFAMPDQVIPDDLIVQGSACIGLDCVNNESFGFDTIRLKENNTRIKFDDTSTGAGFPNHDWQETANDSANGGANKFSIEDITAATVPFTITGSAPTNSIFVDSSGRVGLRTSTPVLDLHTSTSNTPAHRYEQTNAGGFVAQTWDVAGNEANFFVRDVTGGSRLPFRIRPGAPTSSIDINASGNVGVGTASPVQPLHVLRSASAANAFLGFFQNSAGNGASFVELQGGGAGTTAQLGASSAGDFLISTAATEGTFSNERLRITSIGRVGIGTTAPDQVLSVNGDASKSGGGSWQTFSDERLKNIKGTFNSGLKAVMQLQPIRYQYRKDNALGLKSEGDHIGFGAQALQKIIPDAVTQNSAGYLLVNNDPILWTMLNAIKEQQKEIADLKAQVQKLRATSHRRRR
jgi:hypothetical protein